MIMAQSPEYPDLPWIPPRSWTDANRTAVQLVVIHTTEGSAHAQSAEDGAAYDQRRTDGTSTHFFHDSDSTIQCVRTADIAHTARAQGNRRGIHHELCGRTTIDWGGTYAQAMLRRAARQCARDAKKWDIPVRRLTSAQVADGLKGFCGHVEITYAFPADNGTHTDPGPDFPWPQFLDLVRDELEDDMLVKKGDTGEKVKFWQHVLSDLGFAVEVDGDYGDKTEAAVNAYRKAAGVTTTTTQITGWTGWHMLRAQAAKYAGRPGATGPAGMQGPAGAKGDPGPAGPPGQLTGALTVTGGRLAVEAGGRE